MRRAIAFLLMFVLSSMLMAPLFAADPETNLPPCCRTHGKHHCMMQRMQNLQRPDGRPRFAAAHETCPCFPAGTVASHSGKFALSASRPVDAASITRACIPAQTEPGFLSASFDNHPRRGPPSPLA